MKFGANDQSLDDQKRTPKDCVPSDQNESEDLIEKVKSLFNQSDDQSKLSDGMTSTLIDSTIESENPNSPQFQIDERVRLANNKVRLSFFSRRFFRKIFSIQMGTVKYFGSVPFGVNLWYGVELDEPAGKHDGCVGGVRYFTCAANRGSIVFLLEIFFLSFD